MSREPFHADMGESWKSPFLAEVEGLLAKEPSPKVFLEKKHLGVSFPRKNITKVYGSTLLVLGWDGWVSNTQERMAPYIIHLGLNYPYPRANHNKAI